MWGEDEFFIVAVFFNRSVGKHMHRHPLAIVHTHKSHAQTHTLTHSRISMPVCPGWIARRLVRHRLCLCPPSPPNKQPRPSACWWMGRDEWCTEPQVTDWWKILVSGCINECWFARWVFSSADMREASVFVNIIIKAKMCILKIYMEETLYWNKHKILVCVLYSTEQDLQSTYPSVCRTCAWKLHARKYR